MTSITCVGREKAVRLFSDSNRYFQAGCAARVRIEYRKCRIDEAHLFFTDEPENPLNVVAKEARKFGWG